MDAQRTATTRGLRNDFTANRELRVRTIDGSRERSSFCTAGQSRAQTNAASCALGRENEKATAQRRWPWSTAGEGCLAIRQDAHGHGSGGEHVAIFVGLGGEFHALGGGTGVEHRLLGHLLGLEHTPVLAAMGMTSGSRRITRIARGIRHHWKQSPPLSWPLEPHRNRFKSSRLLFADRAPRCPICSLITRVIKCTPGLSSSPTMDRNPIWGCSGFDLWLDRLAAGRV